ncbi:MAG: PAS domain S-box protein, partial [Frankiaceae bacterium]
MKSLPVSLHRHKRQRPANGMGIVVRPAALLLVYTGALVAAAAFAIDVRSSPGEVVTCSAVAGLGAAGALRGGRRWRPVTLGAVFAVTLLVRMVSGSSSGSVPVAAVFAGANVVEAGLFAGLAQWRLPQVHRLDRRSSVLGFLLLSMLVATVGGLIVAVGLHVVGGEAQSVPTTWLIRVAADAIGFILIVPPLLIDDIRGGGWRPWAELTAGAALLAAVTKAGFSGQAFAYPFVPLAVLFFLVLRLGRRGAAVLPLIVVVLSFWHTTAGVGPFATARFDSPLGPVVLVQIYSLVALTGSWLIAAVLDERQAAISALEDANINLEERVRERTAALDSQRRQAQTILGALQDGVVLLDTNQTVVEVNEAFSRLTGFARDDLIGASPPLPWWPPEDSTRISADAAAHVRAATPQYERMLRAADGSLIDAIVQGAPVLDAGAQPVGMVVTFKDIRDRVRRERAEQRGRRQAEELARVSGALAVAGYTEDAVLAAVTGALVDTVADFCVIRLTDGHGLLPAVAVRHRDRAATVQLSGQLSSVLPPVRRGEGLCGPVLSTGCSAMYTTGTPKFREAAGAEQAEQLQRLGVTTIACVPLPVRGDVAGVVTVGRGLGREP